MRDYILQRHNHQMRGHNNPCKIDDLSVFHDNNKRKRLYPANACSSKNPLYFCKTIHLITPDNVHKYALNLYVT